MAIHQWKSKRTDFLVTIVLLFIFMCLFHLMIASGLGRPSHHYRDRDNHEPFEQRLTDPLHVGMSIIGTLLVFSPLYVFRRKVPKSIFLDTDQRLLTIQKRTKKKPQIITLEASGYHYYSLIGFSVFEIYNDFHTRNGSVRKRYLTVLIPKVGMSITDRDLRKLVQLLKEEGVPQEKGAKKRTWQELVWE